MDNEQKYMRRCISLAQKGLGTTYPNPLVGCVIVFEGKIIGEGWHQKSGEAHAEVIAINSVKDKSLLSKSTLYVTLEPCSHHGKTPPCIDLIMQYHIPNVVIGVSDPNPLVSGRGIVKLKEQHVNVSTNFLKDECSNLNKRFFNFHYRKRPYIILKWAESEDGYMSSYKNNQVQPYWISNLYSRQLVHKWRTEEAAIMVGTSTAIEDNPQLNARDWKGLQPLRVLIDKDGKTPSGHSLLDGQFPTLIFSKKNHFQLSKNIKIEVINFDIPIIPKILQTLYKRDIQSLIVEGGTKTIQSFIDLELWDEARVFIGKKFLRNGVKAPIINSFPKEKLNIFGDNLFIYTHTED